MQLSSVYLYPNRLEVYTNLDAWFSERYRKVYQRNIKVYRGVDNRLEFSVKSSDQKAKDITGRYFVFSLVSRESQELVLEKDCIVESINAGKISLTLFESELDNIEPGGYDYSLRWEIRQTEEDSLEFYTVSSSGPLYVDSQYGARGTLDIFTNIKGDPIPSFELKEFKFYTGEIPEDDYYISGIIPTRSQFITPQSLHSFQVYFTSFSGEVILQGSLDEGGNPQTWSDIQTLSYTDSSSDFFNITGKYNFFRFRHTVQSGSVDKILYR